MTTWVPVSKLSIKVPSRAAETYSRRAPSSAASLAAPAGMLVNSSRPQPGSMTAYLLSIETLRFFPSKLSCTWCWPMATWRRHALENDGRAKSSGSPYTRRSSRSEEHTSELQSPCNLVCRLLLEKNKQQHIQADRDDEHERHPAQPFPLGVA